MTPTIQVRAIAALMIAQAIDSPVFWITTAPVWATEDDVMSKYSEFMVFIAKKAQESGDKGIGDLLKEICPESYEEIKNEIEGGLGEDMPNIFLIASTYADHCTAELVAERDALKSLLDQVLRRVGVTEEFGTVGDAQFFVENLNGFDALQVELASLKSEINDQENELNEYRNVMAECRKRLGLAEDADGFDVFTAIGTAVAELAALKAAQEWRGMESAPKDGTRIIIFGSERRGNEVLRNGVVSQSYFCGSFWQVGGFSVFEPTHWQPLPTPPGAKP